VHPEALEVADSGVGESADAMRRAYPVLAVSAYRIILCLSQFRVKLYSHLRSLSSFKQFNFHGAIRQRGKGSFMFRE